jgi:hypothetical protein
MFHEYLDDVRLETNWDSTLAFADTQFPFAHIPSPLCWMDQEICNSPTAYDMMVRSFDHGPKVEYGIEIQAGEQVSIPYKSPVNEYLNQHYTMKCLRVWTSVVESYPYLAWDLGNGYHLTGDPVDRSIESISENGNYFLTLLWRNKKDSHLPSDGVFRLKGFIKTLSKMPSAPPHCFLTISGSDRIREQTHHVSALDIDLSNQHTTADLEKIYTKILGIKKTKLYRSECEPYYVVGCYKPADPIALDEDHEIPEFTLTDLH